MNRLLSLAVQCVLRHPHPAFAIDQQAAPRRLGESGGSAAPRTMRRCDRPSGLNRCVSVACGEYRPAGPAAACLRLAEAGSTSHGRRESQLHQIGGVLRGRPTRFWRSQQRTDQRLQAALFTWGGRVPRICQPWACMAQIEIAAGDLQTAAGRRLARGAVAGLAVFWMDFKLVEQPTRGALQHFNARASRSPSASAMRSAAMAVSAPTPWRNRELGLELTALASEAAAS